MRQACIFACYVVATVALLVLVLVGYALAALYREEWPEEEDAWNCWAFAVPKFLVDPVGSALMVSCSERCKPIPHCRFVPDYRTAVYDEAIPEIPRKGWRALLDSVKFKAKVRSNGR